MKKIIHILLSLLMIFSVFSVNVVAENNEPGLYVVTDIVAYVSGGDYRHEKEFSTEYNCYSGLVFLYYDGSSYKQLTEEELIYNKDEIQISNCEDTFDGIDGKFVSVKPKTGVGTTITIGYSEYSLNLNVNAPYFFVAYGDKVNEDYSNAYNYISGDVGFKQVISVYCGGEKIASDQISLKSNNGVATYDKSTGIITITGYGHDELVYGNNENEMTIGIEAFDPNGGQEDPDADLMGHHVKEDNNDFWYNFYETGANSTLSSRPGWSSLDSNCEEDTLYFAVGVLSGDDGNTCTIPDPEYFKGIKNLKFYIDDKDSRTTLVNATDKVELTTTSYKLTNEITIQGITIKKKVSEPIEGDVVVAAEFTLGEETIIVKHVFCYEKVSSLVYPVPNGVDVTTLNKDIEKWIKENTIDDGSRKEFLIDFAKGIEVTCDIEINFPSSLNYVLGISGNGSTLKGSITINTGSVVINGLNFVGNGTGCGALSKDYGLAINNCKFTNYTTGAKEVSVSENCRFENCATAIETSITGEKEFDPCFDGNTFVECGTGLKITEYNLHKKSNELSVQDNIFINCTNEFYIAHTGTEDEYFFFLNNYYGTSEDTSVIIPTNRNYKSPKIIGSTDGLYVVTSPARMFPEATGHELGIDNGEGIITALFNGNTVNINEESDTAGAQFVTFDQKTGKAVSLAVVPR